MQVFTTPSLGGGAFSMYAPMPKNALQLGVLAALMLLLRQLTRVAYPKRQELLPAPPLIYALVTAVSVLFTTIVPALFESPRRRPRGGLKLFSDNTFSLPHLLNPKNFQP